MLGLYLLGILVGIAVALIAKVTAAKGEAIPFMIELPNYRLPSLKNVALLLWDKTKDFLKRAFTVILIASVVVWLLQSFDFNFHLAVDSSESILACLSGWVAPIFIPMGLGAWQIVTSLICGFMAKESVVSTLSVLLGTTALSAFITPQAAIALLIFSLLYTPCVASIATIRHELGRRWAAVVLVGQCVLAWVLAYAGYLAAGLFR